MKLNDIRSEPGSHKKFKAVGRGIGSGKGKTCGRGVKGQKARTGTPGIRSFEGGQMPLYRRLPKRGFNNVFRQENAIVNLDRIQEAVADGKLDAKQKITEEAMVKAGLVNSSSKGVKLLGGGTLSTKINCVVYSASETAIKAVEKLGGTVTVTKKATAEAAA